MQCDKYVKCIFFTQTNLRINDIFEAFLMQTQINSFETCKPNDLRKMVVEYMATNCEEFKVILREQYKSKPCWQC